MVVVVDLCLVCVLVGWCRYVVLVFLVCLVFVVFVVIVGNCWCDSGWYGICVGFVGMYCFLGLGCCGVW